MNAPLNGAGQQQPPETPDITLSGATVDRLFNHLNIHTILARGQDGAMHPFVDPNPVIATLQSHVMTELKRQGQVAEEGAAIRPQ